MLYFSEGPVLKRKPTPPKGLVCLTSEEKKAESDDEQELVTVTKVVEEVQRSLCVVVVLE